MQKMGVLANFPDFPFLAAQEAVIFIRNKEIWEVADQVSRFPLIRPRHGLGDGVELDIVQIWQIAQANPDFLQVVCVF